MDWTMIICLSQEENTERQEGLFEQGLQQTAWITGFVWHESNCCTRYKTQRFLKEDEKYRVCGKYCGNNKYN